MPRSYSIMRVAGLSYSPPLARLYADNPGLAEKSYQEQLDTVLATGSVYADSFSRAMLAMGHEAVEVLDDHEVLQRAWARERGLVPGENWKIEILLAQIEAFRPDVLYLQDMYAMPHELRRELKERFGFLRLVAMHKGFPGAENELGDVDVMFAGIPTMVESYRKAGLRAELLYHYFNEAVLDRLEASGFADPALHGTHGFTFLGSTGFGYGCHWTRFAMLRELLARTDMEIWAHELPHPYGGSQGDPKMPQKPLAEYFPGRCRPPVFGVEMYGLLSRSKVVFNKHTDAAKGDVGNMKMFEATGVGTCMLVDRGVNMGELFEEGREVVVYDSLEDCLEKAAWLLEHEDERRAIAEAGQRRTLADHSAPARCAQVDAALQELLDKGPARGERR